MVRQSQLFIAAPIRHGRIEDLRTLLETMTCKPGQADPHNALVPFARLRQIHVARFVILEDPSLEDRKICPELPASEPVRLAFVAEFDGSADELVRDLSEEASPGLQAIFGHCQGFEENTPLAEWLLAHRIPSAAVYTNWVGRGTAQIREEAALHAALRAARIANPGASPSELATILADAGKAVPLTPLQPASLAQKLREFGHLLLLPFYGILLLVPLLVALPFLVFMLRRREKSDPVIAPIPDPERNRMLASIEDHDVSNQYSAIGSLKPGRFRRVLTIVLLWLIDWAARHVFKRGRLGRVNTIHFASWTFLDDRRRIFFASNYDGSREAYNDDFINKVAFGLNLSFSNGLGYPRTDWLIVGGARHEQDFKHYLFHHQIPTQFWYKAFPGLTTYDMARNARIRAGFEKLPAGDALKRWIAEI